MPELPEAETIVRDLQRTVAGATVRGVKVIRPDILARNLTAVRLGRVLRGKRILAVTRRAKAVVLELEGGWRLVISLGMTGHVQVGPPALSRELTHVAARLDLADGRAIFYDDARRFGRLDLRDHSEWQERSAQLGVEPLSPEFTPERLHALTRGSITPIRNWLLDQRRVAGVGNIYASEALHRAGIRPTRRTRTLRRAETSALHAAVQDVLAEAVTARGTTVSDYRDGEGRAGSFQFHLRVYDREHEPCLNCGTPIRRVVRSNRAAFYCPTCQR